MEIDNELLSFFRDEAGDLLDSIEALFLCVNKNGWFEEELTQLKRNLHNLKGTSNSLGLNVFGDSCHKVEDYLADCDENSLQIDINYCLEVVDNLKKWLNNPDDFDLEMYNKSLFSDLQSTQIQDTKYLNTSVIKPDSLEQEQLSEVNKSQKAAPLQSGGEAKPVDSTASSASSGNDDYIKCKKDKIDTIINLFSEMVTIQAALMFLKKDYSKNENDICNAISQMEKITSDLQRGVLSLRMENLNKLFSILDRSIYGAAEQSGVSVQVNFEGRDTELDRGIIKKLIDPLCHLVRNCVDHGFSGATKPQNTLNIHAYQKAGFFYLDIQDNGVGINLDKVIEKAQSIGIDASKLSRNEIINLIFEEELSTKDEISDLSGRGIGMNVVKEVIENLKGSIRVETQEDKGTFFQIKLPLSLSVFNGAVVSVNGNKYVIPNSEIKEIIDLRTLITSELEDKKILRLREIVIPVLDLSDYLPSRNGEVETDKNTVIVTQVNGGLCALQVEKILFQQKVVGKNLSEELSDIKLISGATILGNGELVPILNVGKINQLEGAAA